MRTTILGRTGLEVSVAGLGAGGPSRLGQREGAERSESVALVVRALDAGVNLIDTAPAYGTEEIVGEAIGGRRKSVVLSTKCPLRREGLPTGAQLTERLEKSLRSLGTDWIDIYHLHGVAPDAYDYCLAELVPAMERLREAGKIRFLGVTERFAADTSHDMLSRAVHDACWDVAMVGFNLLNPSARARVLAPARARGTGTLVMFAVRRALSRPEVLRGTLEDLVARGVLQEDVLEDGDPLAFLLGEHGGAAETLPEAAYRFCVHEPGVDVVLTGTGSAAHLEENLLALDRGPLPERDLERLEALFGRVDSTSGN